MIEFGEIEPCVTVTCTQGVALWWESFIDDAAVIQANLVIDAKRYSRDAHPAAPFWEKTHTNYAAGANDDAVYWLWRCVVEHPEVLRRGPMVACPDEISIVLSLDHFANHVVFPGKTLSPQRLQYLKQKLEQGSLKPSPTWEPVRGRALVVWVTSTAEIDAALGSGSRRQTRMHARDRVVRLTGRTPLPAPNPRDDLPWVEIVLKRVDPVADLRRPTFVDAGGCAEWRAFDGKAGWGATLDMSDPRAEQQGLSEAVVAPLRLTDEQALVLADFYLLTA